MTETRPLPTGTVTFLRTDVEGSMGLTRALGERWDAVNARHIDLIRTAVTAHDGRVVRTEGDAVVPDTRICPPCPAAATRAARLTSNPP